jgi:hypothetical protein
MEGSLGTIHARALAECCNVRTHGATFDFVRNDPFDRNAVSFINSIEDIC